MERSMSEQLMERTRTEPVTTHRVRIESVDLLRGIIMILMALDHTRDYFGNLAVNPTDPATTTIPLFFTRWITHVCAPGFFLLTGIGAALTLGRMSRRELSRYLFTRGVWLIVLELVVLRALGWQFNIDFRVTLLNVLWALGWSMIALSVLIHLPTWAVSAVGVVMIATHVVFVAYALIPWMGVTAAGYGLGRVYQWDSERRKRFLRRLGFGLIVGFLALRAINVYGDPVPWTPRQAPSMTVLSFLNTSKYPPSLLFLLMALGPIVLGLSTLDARSPRLLRPALVFGRVPLFYFALHIVLIHLLAVVVCFARYGEVYWMFQSNNLAQFPITQPPGWPVSLPVVYLIWIGVVLALYPLCRWFSGVRHRRSEWWLSYL
jgi:uncharacterized membrane protein